MAHVIFVHGMKAKAGSWLTIPEDVEKAGHTVSNKTLPGHSYEFGHLLYGMRRYVRSVVAQFPSTGKVVLIGHSMGGFVISQVAADYADRVEKLIYVTAMLPEDNEPMLKIMSDAGSTLDDVAKEFDDVGIPLNGPLMGSQPLRVMAEPFDSSPDFEALPRHYIRCKDDTVIPLSYQNKMIDRAKGTAVTASDPIESGHIPQATKPDKLLDQILQELP